VNAILELEQATMEVLPAPHEARISGWRARTGFGTIGRLNSAVPLGHLPSTPDTAIDTVERWFREHDVEPAFRLTRLDVELDRILDGRGYLRSPDVLVMTGPVAPSADEGLRLDPWPDDGWLARYRRFGSHSQLRAAELRASLELLALPHTVASIGQEAVAVGAVLDRWVTVHSIAVDPDRRRQRYGSRITTGLLSWGARLGAEAGFLHVDAENPASVALHTSLGFRTHHRYWYRRGRLTPPPTGEGAP
jgi:ribosomal protein S18 acetylase RimI-like enzyme